MQEMRLEAAQGGGEKQGRGQGSQSAAEEQEVREAGGATMARDRDERGAAARLRAAGERQQQPLPRVAAAGVDQKARYHVIPRWEPLDCAVCIRPLGTSWQEYGCQALCGSILTSLVSFSEMFPFNQAGSDLQ